MNGTVSISLKDFDELREAQSKAETRQTGLLRAAKELEVFLSFLCTRDSISEYIEEFNRQSQTSRINIDEGRAKIVFRDGAEN
jgi:hypothetical protein|tara:strand:+ start:141 stop:389 length:249 start_codon:yes stop_codon:yes gene_type:complete